MTPRRLLRVAIAPLALLALTAPSALADTQISAQAPASNVTTYGATTIWSTQLADGTWRLAMSVSGAAPVVLNVPGSPVAFDPDLGPGADGPVAVYSRCTGASATRGCDVYSYDVHTGVEAKVGAISKAATSEYAPSYWKGWVGFARAGGSRPGTYWYKPGKPLMRLDSRPAAETDISDIMLAYIRKAGGSTSLRTTNFAGTKRRTVVSAILGGSGDGDVLSSPSVQRYRLYFLDRSPVNESALIKRTGIRNPNRGTAIQVASPTPAGDIQSISAYRQPIFYTRASGAGGAGVFVTAPVPAFPGYQP